LQHFIRFLRSEACQNHATEMAGNDVFKAGAVRWTGQRGK
jgi:hypothetical protein